ncbi:MAG: ABC transporter substrate-binding protein [Rhodospirillaceae bacterium]
MTASQSDDSPQPWRHWSKRKLFLVILGIAACIASAISLIIHLAVVRPGEEEVRLAVVAPLSGPDKGLGEEIRRGAALFIDQVNAAGGLNHRPLKLLTFDDGDDPVKARAAAEAAIAAGAVGVVGHASPKALEAAAEIYREHSMPVITPAADLDGEITVNPWVFRNSFSQLYEIRFLANFVRNVVGEKTVSIILQSGAENEALAQAFDEVMQRFGTKVLYRWDFDAAAPDFAARTQAIAADIKDKKLIGTFLVLGSAAASAKVLTTLRRTGIDNRVIGPRVLASNSFRSALKAEWAESEAQIADLRRRATLASGLNGVLTTTPLLFDTAGELAQGFKNGYVKAHRTQPDWLAASAFDAMRLMVYAHGRPRAEHATMTPEQFRTLEREHLAALDGGHARIDSLFGPVAFNAHGISAPQTMIGVYDGVDIVAAMTQLSPIREENIGNYLDELVAGRALYVNDRFMYKTNVVYAGIKMEKISGLDVSTNTVFLSFEIWFRWRGNIDPQDLVFTNAVEPVKLEKPEREAKVGDMLYRSYRAKGKFYLNYSSVERGYGTQIIGVSFHHRTLARNNLMYVSDILGMDMNSSSTLAEQLLKSNLVLDLNTGAAEASFFQRLATQFSPSSETTDPLVDAMLRSRVLAGVNGWVLDRAWISQDIARRGAEGDPAFVGFGKPQPEFSLLDMGSLLKPDQIDPRDFIPNDWFVVIAIFSLVGSVVANLLDRKDRGQFWRMQTLGLRIVAWPLLLMSSGNMALDYGLQNLTTSTVDTIVVIYSGLWWIVPARLGTISLERFVWVPLEIRTGRKIPNIVRAITALIIYLFAIFGVIAFVMGKTVTSLLATSGLMAMIIGLAIQANIANIFSGIVLNIERPFNVGDYIKLNANVMGQVIDITWRTIRIRHLEGQLVCLANAKVSEAEIHNYSNMDANFVRVPVFVDPRYDPRLVRRLIKDALDSFDIFLNLTSAYFGPDAQFKGVECQNGIWAARYRVKFYVKKGNDENVVVNEVMARIWERFHANGIDWSPPAPAAAGPAAFETVVPLLAPPLTAES